MNNTINNVFIPTSYDMLLDKMYRSAGFLISGDGTIIDNETMMGISYGANNMKGIVYNYDHFISTTVDDGQYLRLDNSKIFNKFLDYCLVKFGYITDSLCSTYMYVEDSKAGPYGLNIIFKENFTNDKFNIETNRYYNKSLRFIEAIILMFDGLTKENINLSFVDTIGPEKLYTPIIILPHEKLEF